MELFRSIVVCFISCFFLMESNFFLRICSSPRKRSVEIAYFKNCSSFKGVLRLILNENVRVLKRI